MDRREREPGGPPPGLASARGKREADVAFRDARRPSVQRAAEAMASGVATPGTVAALQHAAGNAAFTKALGAVRQPVEGTDRGDGVNVSHPTDRSQRMAEANASWVLSAEAPAAASAPVVQRAAAHGSPSTGATHAVQRAGGRQVMPPAAFKEATSSRVPRGTSRITEVDEALESFHAVTSEEGQSRAGNIAALRAIVRACDAYLASSNRGSRKQGVETLRGQAQGRAEMLDSVPEQFPPLPSSGTPAQLDEARAARFRELLATMDRAMIELQDDEYDYELSLLDLPNQAYRAADNLSDENFAALMRGYLRQLRSMASEPDLPQETRAALQEILVFADRIEFAKTKAKSGMRANPPYGTGASGDRSYTFEVDAQARGGTSFLLGHMAHEFTHVAAHQAYDATDAMLLLPIDTPDQKVAEIARQRTDTLANLMRALQNEERLFTESQYSLLKEKVDYGSQTEKVLNYARNLHGNGRLTDAEFEKLKRWDALAAGGSGTLVEYDTVLNQMLVYLHQWKTPEDSVFYRQLRAAAAEATAQRQTARAARVGAGA
jgi:hypothetical protein